MSESLLGKVTDFGDVLYVQQLLIKGKRPSFAFHFGTPRKTTPADRVVHGVGFTSSAKVDVIMDLQADKMVDFGIGAWADEMGNPVPAPAGVTVVYTVSDPTVLNLTDNGDGTGVIAAVGILGSATLHAEVTLPGATPRTADALVTVVAGDAERFEIVFGTPTEVTPDA